MSSQVRFVTAVDRFVLETTRDNFILFQETPGREISLIYDWFVIIVRTVISPPPTVVIITLPDITEILL